MFSLEIQVVSILLIWLISCCFQADGQKTSVTFNNKIYTFYKVKVPYDMASLICRATNSSLVNIKTRGIQMTINRQLWLDIDYNFNQVGYWTGGRTNNKGDWMWNDGAPIPIHHSTGLDYSQHDTFMESDRFDPQPRNCLAVSARDYFQNDNTGKWQLYSCATYNYFICQKDINSSSTISLNTDFSCDDDNSLMFGIIIFLVILASLLLFVVLVLSKKFHQTQRNLKLFIKQYSADPIPAPTKKQSPTKKSSKNEDRLTTLMELPHNRGIISDAGYEVVNSQASSQGRHLNQPTYEVAQRLRGESGLYMEIPEESATGKRRQSSNVWKKQSPYLDMRGSKDSSSLSKTLSK